MTDQDWIDLHNARVSEMPPEVLQKAVDFLTSELGPAKTSILELYNEDPIHWVAEHHMFWGMQVRNALRGIGLKDDMLPSGNWDDYYVPCVEMAIGVRPIPGGSPA